VSPHRRWFLASEAALYLSFLLLDALGRAPWISTALKYASILLCLGAALGRRGKGRDHALTAGALAFTALADLFLLVLDRWYLLGVAVFCAAQTCYALRLGPISPKRAALRLGLPLAALPLLARLGLLTPLNALSAVYFSQLALNALGALALRPPNPLFAAGLFLFLGCDLCVGAHTLFPGLPLAGFGMWLFYLPSQVCLTLSPKEVS